MKRHLAAGTIAIAALLLGATAQAQPNGPAPHTSKPCAPGADSRLKLSDTQSMQAPKMPNATNGTGGSNGSNGANGVDGLVGVVAKQPGANCTTGGQAIEIGYDMNGNGALDLTEVTSTQYVCNAPNAVVHDGDLTISNASETYRLVGVQRIRGTLYIDAASATTPTGSLPTGTERTWRDATSIANSLPARWPVTYKVAPSIYSARARGITAGVDAPPAPTAAERADRRGAHRRAATTRQGPPRRRRPPRRPRPPRRLRPRRGPQP